jgi:RNA polymerase sigma factor (sigma-70 family)
MGCRMEIDDDMLLLLRLKTGDVQAYGRLFRKYFKALSVEAYYILKDEMEADDQVQDLFVEIWDKQLYLTIHSSVKYYLHASIRNRCLKVLEKDKNKQKRFRAYVQIHPDRVDGNVVESVESEKMIHSVLQELPYQRARAFSLVYLEDRKYKEAAAEMGITINSIKTHLKLAMKVLRDKFMDHGIQ